MSAMLSLAIVTLGLLTADAQPLAEQGQVSFVATAKEVEVPERFRLPPQSFRWQAQRLETVTETLEVWDVTFPSPVVTPHACNNTVYCEYYRSRREGKHPAVIVLHILGGDFELSRLFCNALAQHGCCALFVKMPYYGPRRDPESAQRMISLDPQQTVAGMTQAVLDIRRATAWLGERPEIDADRLGIFGISLGGITSGLAATAEPRLTSVCLLLAGGDVARVAWDSPGMQKVREKYIGNGGTRESFLEGLREVDPVTYAPLARGKRILMLNAAQDEVVPRACTESLWNALGQPEIHWYPGGHYSSIWHLPSALSRVSHFFADQ
jgi:dienelactone hydrolase